jgi:hypothetical protein
MRDQCRRKVPKREFTEGEHIVVDAGGDQLVFRAGAREAVAAGYVCA